MTLPEIFLSRMESVFNSPTEFARFLESYDLNASVGLRANTLKIAPDRLMEIVGETLGLTPVGWCPEGFYYDEKSRPAKHPFYHAGLYYIQEPSAMSPASVLDVTPGQKVLDICAAPGGKTTHLGAKLRGEGLLVANDVSATRCKALLKNIELAGITNAVITNEQPERLTARFPEYFDRILVDAPCSGEGMFRKDPDAVKAWTENKPEQCRNLQRAILHHSAGMLKPGGRLIYSTCTFSTLENEDMIREFLNNNRNFKILPVDHNGFGFSKGIGSDEVACNSARLWPHRLRGEGHFLALLEKEATPDDGVGFDAGKNEPKIKDMLYFNEFCQNHLNKGFDQDAGCFALHGQSLFFTPRGLPSLNGIRLFRSGFYLGDLKTKRFEPSQALAMGIKKDDARLVVDFSVSDPALSRYLRGESFEVPDSHDGWNLVCVGGFPLGWGKISKGRLKNKYLKSWMMN